MSAIWIVSFLTNIRTLSLYGIIIDSVFLFVVCLYILVFINIAEYCLNEESSKKISRIFNLAVILDLIFAIIYMVIPMRDDLIIMLSKSALQVINFLI